MTLEISLISYTYLGQATNEDMEYHLHRYLDIVWYVTLNQCAVFTKPKIKN